MIIAPLTEKHYPAVKRIYEQGLATGNSTFQTSSPNWKEWYQSHINNCRIVGIENGQVIDWLGSSNSGFGKMCVRRRGRSKCICG